MCVCVKVCEVKRRANRVHTNDRQQHLTPPTTDWRAEHEHISVEKGAIDGTIQSIPGRQTYSTHIIILFVNRTRTDIRNIIVKPYETINHHHIHWLKIHILSPLPLPLPFQCARPPNTKSWLCKLPKYTSFFSPPPAPTYLLHTYTTVFITLFSAPSHLTYPVKCPGIGGSPPFQKHVQHNFETISSI